MKLIDTVGIMEILVRNEVSASLLIRFDFLHLEGMQRYEIHVHIKI